MIGLSHVNPVASDVSGSLHPLGGRASSHGPGKNRKSKKYRGKYGGGVLFCPGDLAVLTAMERIDVSETARGIKDLSNQRLRRCHM